MDRNDEIFEYLVEEFPEIASDLLDSVMVLYDSCDDALNTLKSNITKAMGNNDFEKAREFVVFSAELLKVIEDFKSVTDKYHKILNDNAPSSVKANTSESKPINTTDSENQVSYKEVIGEETTFTEEKEADKSVVEDLPNIIEKVRDPHVDFVYDCVKKLESFWNTKLIKISRNAFRTADYQKGCVIVTSKALYDSDNSERFWFGHRPNTIEKIKNCKERFEVFGCKNADNLVCIPLDDIESQAGNLSVSKDKLGNVRHRHIILSIDVLRSVYWKVPYPVEKEINVTKYLID